MEMTGQYRIPAPRQRVWAALNDPEILRQAIPGCEEIEKTSDTSFTAKVRAKVGPVSATFTGAVTLSDLDPPNAYTISGEGKGGVAGFAKGGAKVRLLEDGDGTILQYTVTANVGGKLAQIGSRLIDATANKLSAEFFAHLGTLITAGAPAGETSSAAASAMAAPSEPPADAPPSQGQATKGLPPWVWVGGVVLFVVLIVLFFGRGG
ncbi:MAG: carbon monoxide dehydrogenase subunit G [Proteobacteria bacterium]|nr:carbon monoxide dehydrogenase subunit G [Pseudomonadota bacterium]